MDPARKRKIRLIVALSAAVVLAGALIYTSFSASDESVDPSRLLASAQIGRSYQLTGKVAAGSVQRSGSTLAFRVQDRDGRASVPVVYHGSVPDPFREGREVIVTVSKRADGSYAARDNSLITKCPSKYKAQGTPS